MLHVRPVHLYIHVRLSTTLNSGKPMDASPLGLRDSSSIIIQWLVLWRGSLVRQRCCQVQGILEQCYEHPSSPMMSPLPIPSLAYFVGVNVWKTFCISEWKVREVHQHWKTQGALLERTGKRQGVVRSACNRQYSFSPEETERIHAFNRNRAKGRRQSLPLLPWDLDT